MERLLEDAGRLANTKFDISSLEDVYTAIHVIQENMGITGTTSQEAAKTIEGSVGSMKAAWENLVTAFGVSEMPIDTYVTNFVDSISTAAENVVPRIGLIVKNIGEKLPGALSRLFENLKKSIEENDLGTALLDGIDALVTNASTEIQKAFNSLFDGDTLSGLLTRATGTVGTITEALSNMFKTILGRLPEIVSGAAGILRNMGGTIWGTLMDTLTTLTDGDSLTQIVDSVGGLIEDAVSRLAQDLPTIVSSLVELITRIAPQVASALLDNMEPMIRAVNDILISLLDSLTKDDGLLDGLVDGISAIVDSIVDNIDPVLLAVQDLLTTVLEKLLEPEVFTKLVHSAAEILGKLFEGAAKVAGSSLGFIVELGQSLGDALVKVNWVELLSSAWEGIGKGILEGLGFDMTYWDEYFEELGGKIFDWIDEFKTNIGTSIIEGVDDILEWIERIPEKFGEMAANAASLGSDFIGNLIGGMEDNPLVKGASGIGSFFGDLFGFGDKEKQISNGFSNGSGGASPDSRRNVTINYTQNNTSQQALDEYEIWRQNKRAMDDLRAKLGGVW